MANISNDFCYVAPLDVLSVEHMVTFAEGITPEVSIEYNVSVGPLVYQHLPGIFEISKPYSMAIFPLSNR